MYLKNEALVDEVKTVMEEWDWRQNHNHIKNDSDSQMLGSNRFGAF